MSRDRSQFTQVAAAQFGESTICSNRQLFGNTVVSLASAGLTVSLPIFAFLLIRLKKAERANPELKSDPSRKRAIQIIFIGTILVRISNFIFYVYAIFNAGRTADTSLITASSPAGGIPGNLVHLLITTVIAGSILA